MSADWAKILRTELADVSSLVGSALRTAGVTAQQGADLANETTLHVQLRPVSGSILGLRGVDIDELGLRAAAWGEDDGIGELAQLVQAVLPEELENYSPRGGPRLGLLLKLWLVDRDGDLEDGLRASIDASAIDELIDGGAKG